MRIHTSTPTRPVNLLGDTFLNSSKASQLRFKAAMLDAGERDGFNYWRSYQDNWRYEKQLGRIPFVIIVLAMQHIGYKHPSPNEQKVDM